MQEHSPYDSAQLGPTRPNSAALLDSEPIQKRAAERPNLALSKWAQVENGTACFCVSPCETARPSFPSGHRQNPPSLLRHARQFSALGYRMYGPGLGFGSASYFSM